MKEKEPNKMIWENVLLSLKDRFDLNDDKASEEEVKDTIRRGVEFKGTNLWVLMFATFIASLGLNVNSTAVIIGAMLISPLMGPIMGIGLSVGINDFELLKRSLRNFGFMVLVGIFASTAYFLVSPISQAQSELLSRTIPTTYDVLIAFFGGLAGIVAQSRRDRTSTVIPGVAIATALMPPLCTAGFGIATLQFNYMIGALYLFFINTVFIAIATFLVVRFLKYSKKEFLDRAREQRVRRYMVIIMICTLVPSFVMGVRIVRQSIFTTYTEKYVNSLFTFPKSQVIDYKSKFGGHNQNSTIEVFLLGEPLPEETIEYLRLQLENYNLPQTDLQVHQQAGDGTSVSDYKILNSSYIDIITEKNKQIHQLELQLNQLSGTLDSLPTTSMVKESTIWLPRLEEISFARSVQYKPSGSAVDTTLICLVQLPPGDTLQAEERERLRLWLEQRTHMSHITIYQK